MTHKYKLGDYIEYYTSYYRNGDKIEYMDPKQGFVNGIEDRMQEDGSVTVYYTVGAYIGAYGYIVREGAIIGKTKTPKHKSKLEYMKAKIRCNEASIKRLSDENKTLRRGIEILEEEQTK